MIDRWVLELIALVVVVSGGALGFVIHDRHEQKIGATLCENRVTQSRNEFQIAEDRKTLVYAEQTAKAQQQYETELRNITPLRVPVIMHDGALCVSPVRRPAAAGGSPSESGGTDSGSERDRDIGPALAAFEVKYEGILADCRKLLSDWPN